MSGYDGGATYDRMRARWAFLHDSYWGGERYRSPSRTSITDQTLYETYEKSEGVVDLRERKRYTSYLIPHPLENDANFLSRLALASFVNVCQPIVDAYAESVTGGVRREVDPIAAYLDDVDGRGSSWAEHAEEIARWAATYGCVATVVDTPAANPAASAAAEAAMGVRPFVVIVPPTSWAWIDADEHGQVTEFAYAESPYVQDLVAPTQQTIRVRVWRADSAAGPGGWSVVDATIGGSASTLYGARTAGTVTPAFSPDGRQMSGPLPSQLGGRIPVEFAFFRRVSDSRWPLGISLIDDAADLAREVYNKLSWESEIHRKAGFPQLTIPLGRTGGQMDSQTRLALGMNTAIPYNSETGAPQWIAPSSESSRELRESCVFRVALAFRTTGLEVAADQSAQVQSGEALRIRSRDFNSRASRFARNMQRYEVRMLSLIGRLVSRPFDPVVTYARRFTLPDIGEDIRNALSVLGLPIETGAEPKLAALRQVFDAALNASDDQIDEWLKPVRAMMGQDAAVFDAARQAQIAEQRQRTASPTNGASVPPVTE